MTWTSEDEDKSFAIFDESNFLYPILFNVYVNDCLFQKLAYTAKPNQNFNFLYLMCFICSPSKHTEPLPLQDQTWTKKSCLFWNYARSVAVLMNNFPEIRFPACSMDELHEADDDAVVARHMQRNTTTNDNIMNISNSTYYATFVCECL